MRRTAIVSLLVVFGSSYALAGTVEFTPPEQTACPGLVSMDLSVTTTIDQLVGIDSTDIVIGSELPIVSFTYSTPSAFETVYTPAPPGIYAHNLWLGASNTRPDTGGDSHLLGPEVFPVNIGTLVVDASGASAGNYTVWVDTTQDECSGLGATVLTGVASEVTVVSEPLDGSTVIHVLGSPCLGESDPLCDSSLTRAHDNCVRFTFTGNVSAPNPGDIKIQQLQAGGAYDPTDLSNQFTFTVEGGNVLKIAENDDVLSNGTWYAIRNTGDWSGVAPFKVDYRVVYGDVDNNGSTTAADASDVWGSRGPALDCNPYDIDANGSITASDASDVWGYRGSTAPDKPTGHVCSP